MHASRESIAASAADAIERAARLGSLPSALVGFDGFVDSIIHVVDRRRDMTPGGYERMKSIAGFAARCAAAAGKSANIELVVSEDRFGGNGPLMAGALGAMGSRVTYIGAVGKESDPRTLHPLYAEFACRCERVIPVAPPAHTDAFEFDDGKLMFGKPANVQGVTWESLRETPGLDTIRLAAANAAIIGVVNWVLMGGVESIWEGLLRDVLPALPPPPAGLRRRFYVDLSDPAKRTDADITRAMAILRRVNGVTPVTLGLNLAESERISLVTGIGAYEAAGMRSLGDAVRTAAERLREQLGLACVVVHPREGAAAADEHTSAWFDGPFTGTPRLSTGAGDHFNAGFAFAHALGLSLDQCLAAGAAVSGAYVRDARSPGLDRLLTFLRGLPPPEDSARRVFGASPPGRTA